MAAPAFSVFNYKAETTNSSDIECTHVRKKASPRSGDFVRVMQILARQNYIGTGTQTVLANGVKDQGHPSLYPLSSFIGATLERTKGLEPTISHSVGRESPRKVFETNI